MENKGKLILKEISHEKINKLEEREILKAATSLNVLNDVINGRNDPLYKILHLVDRFQDKKSNERQNVLTTYQPHWHDVLIKTKAVWGKILYFFKWYISI